MMLKRFREIFAGAVVGVFLVLTMSGSGLAADTIKLGVAGPHSGEFASSGIPTTKAAELVARDINARGGILGKKVELLIEDDVCKAEVAIKAANKLVSQGVHAVLGHICSDATKAALGVYRHSKIIVMSPSVTTPALTQSGEYPNFFRTIASDDAQARLEVDFALNRLKFKKLAVLHDKGDHGKGLAEFAKGFLEKDNRAEVVLYEGITPGAVDYSEVVQKIKRKKADAVIFGGYHPEASKIATLMRKKKMEAVFMGADGIKNDAFIKTAGKYAEGIYATGPKNISRNPMMIAVKEAYQKAYGSAPGLFFDSAYAAALALLNAIDKAGSTDYDAVKKALHTEFVETPLGIIRFDQKGDATRVGFAVYQVQNGVYIEIK